MGQINRTGRVSFGDASLCVWEEGLGGSLQERDAWEKAFKRQVFKRIIQALNRLGWKCGHFMSEYPYRAERRDVA